MECSFEGCGRKRRTKGLCGAHYDQQWKGKPLTTLRKPKRIVRPASLHGYKVCLDCDVEKPQSDFYKFSHSPDGLSTYCSTCLATRQRRNKTDIIQWVSNIKTDVGCVDCGYNNHAEALEFDHLPGFEKVKNIAEMVNKLNPRSWIEAEIAKCEVVCANCHRVRTANRRKETPSE